MYELLKIFIQDAKEALYKKREEEEKRKVRYDSLVLLFISLSDWSLHLPSKSNIIGVFFSIPF